MHKFMVSSLNYVLQLIRESESSVTLHKELQDLSYQERLTVLNLDT